MHDIALPDGVSHVWWMHNDLEVQKLVDGARGLLTAEEQLRVARFGSESRKREYAAGRILAKTVLGRYLHISPSLVRFGISPWGKPFLVDPPKALFFNLSHSNGLIVCAVSRAEVGVDAERAEVAHYEVMDHVFDEREVAWIEKHTGEAQMVRAFYTVWTRKEAAMKALGKGFSLSPAPIAVSLGPGWSQSGVHDFQTFEPIPGHLASVATARNGGSVHTLVHAVEHAWLARALKRGPAGEIGTAEDL